MAKNSAIDSSFSEVASNPPTVVQSTMKKFGPQRARKQSIAIALSKARKRGSNLPSPKLKTGGKAY